MEEIFTASKCLGHDEVQKYLQAQLNEQERFKVENHLLDCSLCSDAVEGFANHHNVESDLKEIKTSIQERITAPTAKVRPLSASRFSFNNLAAAILMLLIPIAGYLYWQGEGAQQVAQAFDPINENKLLAELRSGDGSDFQNAELKKGMGYYDLKEYQKSLTHYQLALQQEPENTVASFFAGIVSLELGNAKEAIPYLIASRINDERFYDQSTWYLLMAHLKLNDKLEAKRLLEDLLKNKEGTYYQRALDLKATLGN